MKPQSVFLSFINFLRNFFIVSLKTNYVVLLLVSLFGINEVYGQGITCTTVTPVTLSASNSTICKNTVQTITANGGNITDVPIVKEDFNNDLTGWTFENKSLNGVPSNAAWKLYDNGYSYSSFSNNSGNFHSNDNSSFIMSHSWAQGNSIFKPSKTDTSLTSPVFDLTGYSSVSLSFYHFYRDNDRDDTATVQISTNGSTWQDLETYTSTQGSVSRFSHKIINLNNYIGQATVQIRFKYVAAWDWYWAIDNFSINGSWQKITWVPTTNLFTDEACTIPYIANTNALQVWAKPNTTTTYTASATNGSCTKTASVTYTTETATWNSAWSSQPSKNKSIIFESDYTSAGRKSVIEGCDCTVKGGNITFASTDALILKNELIITEGSLTFENDASLVQINNIANSGSINYKRQAKAIRGFDFVYWSAPVANQNIGNLYESPTSGAKYTWNTTVRNSNGGEGDWQGASGIMQVGKGYIIRGSSNYGMPATDISTSFRGVPNNGNISVEIARGNITTNQLGFNGVLIDNLSDNFNLIGNPYPSAIDAVKFLVLNTRTKENPTGALLGNVQLWKHGYQPDTSTTNPFYGSFTYNYSGNDYVTINLMGSTDPKDLELVIKSGQSFMVQMIDGAKAISTVSFQNSLRFNTSNSIIDNSNFFRENNTANVKHRIWLDLMDQNNIASTTLIGYATDATNGFDTFYDARAAVPDYMKIYSLIASEIYEIQGKSLPFNSNEEVPLGITTVQAGNYKIGINTVDGLFLEPTQTIYLEDKHTGIIHNLKTSPYNFTATAGTFNNRFVLRYANETLSLDTFTKNEVKVYASENINVIATNQTIKSVRVYDLLGRILGNFNGIDELTFSTAAIKKTSSALIVEVQLENGATQSYKVIY